MNALFVFRKSDLNLGLNFIKNNYEFVFSWSSLQSGINLNILLFFRITQNLIVRASFEIWLRISRWEKFNISIFDNILGIFISVSISSINNVVGITSKNNSRWLCVVDLNIAAILIEGNCVISHFSGGYIWITIEFTQFNIFIQKLWMSIEIIFLEEILTTHCK